MTADTDAPTKLTVLISGSGTNLQALIDACASSPPALASTSIVRVISNRKSAYGLERAQAAGIPTAYHNLVPYAGKYPSSDPSTKYGAAAREAYDADLAELVLRDAPDLVVCAGWMHIVSPVFLTRLERSGVQIINLHPGLPNGLAGANCIQRAWDAFQAGTMMQTGVMIHYVIAAVDLGQPIVYKAVDKIEGESLEDLEARMYDIASHLPGASLGSANMSAR